MRRESLLPAPSRGGYDRSLTRVERDAQQRERLLLATASVAAEGRATVARIIERAGVGRSTFYEFFDSPEHVLEHLEQRTLRTLDAALERAFAGARTPLERVRAISKSWLNELEARPMEAKLVLTHRREADYLSAAGNSLRQMLERILDAARADGHAWFTSGDEVSVLAATAAVEAASRRHIAGPPIREASRIITELVTKLLR